MRRHFIYNNMTSICCLCSQDSDKAQQAVVDSTDYLRKSFNALACTVPIPFTSELGLARAYLAVEQLQYAESLCVEYGTPHTFFRIPMIRCALRACTRLVGFSADAFIERVNEICVEIMAKSDCINRLVMI